MNKKYCIFSAQYMPHMGGVERYTYCLAKELIRLGNSVTVVTSQVDGLSEYEQSEKIEIYRLPSYNLMKGRLPILKNCRTTKRISEILKKKGYDFILINTRFYFLSIYGAMFAKKNAIKSVVVEHGTGYLSFNNIFLDVIEKIYEHGITAVLKRYCNNYVGVSKSCCQWSAHFGIKSKGVLYNAIDVDEIEAIASNPVLEYRKEYDIDEETMVITYTGRMLIDKGVYQLLDAISVLNSKKNVVLFMAGDGPELAQITQKANEISSEHVRIVILGRIDYSHIVALLKDTDIYCLPSKSEGFPTSVLEAVASRCYVVTTYNGGAKELITDGVTGTILKNNKVEPLQRALEIALERDEYRECAKNKAYEDLKQNFTWKKTAEKLCDYNNWLY